jgi:hypothetical protein
MRMPKRAAKIIRTRAGQALPRRGALPTIYFFRMTLLQARKQVDSEPRCENVS